MRYPGDWFYHFMSPEGGHPTWEEHFIEKKIKMKGPFFLATPVNQIDKSSEMLFQHLQQIYIGLINMIFPLCLLLTNHETLYNLNIVLSFHPPLEPISALNNYRSVASSTNSRQLLIQLKAAVN